jgi:hypothetical protein
VFFGIDLPDVVGLARPGGLGRATASLRGRAEASVVEPTLQGAFAGQLRGRVVTAQENADESSPPARVLAAQSEGVVVKPLVDRRPGAFAVVVNGSEAGVAAGGAALQEVANGSERQPERLGDGGRGLAALVASEDSSTQREGSRCRHGKPSQGVEKPGGDDPQRILPPHGKTRCRISRQNQLSHFAAKLDVG